MGGTADIHGLELFDVIPRFAAVGTLLLACALLIRDARTFWAGRFVAAFAITSAAYLFCSYAPVRELLGPLLTVLMVLCIAGPAFLWLSALAIFVDGFTPRWKH